MRVYSSDEVFQGHSRLDAQVRDPDAIYAAYEDEMTAQGATIEEPTLTLELIEDLVAVNAYSDCLLAVGAFGGAKNLGALNQRVYSVGPGFLANDVAGTLQWVELDTATYTYPVYNHINGSAFLSWTALALRGGRNTSFLLQNPSHGAQGAGANFFFTSDSKYYDFVNGQMVTGVYVDNAGTPGAIIWPQAGALRLGPETDTVAELPFIAGWWMDHVSGEMVVSIDGINTLPKCKVFHDFPGLAAAATPTVKLFSGNGNMKWAEFIVLGGDHPSETMKDLAALRATRYA